MVAENSSPSPRAAVLEIRDVRKTYRTATGAEVRALAGISLRIGAGEMVSLVGPSGCGKTTLFRLIAGLELPSGGEILSSGEPIAGPSASRGVVFQDPNLFPWLTVRKNIELGLRIRGQTHQRRDDVDELIKLVGLPDFAHAYPHQLSGGMAQRAALARALVNHPMMLLLDEPLGALDAFTRMRMQDEVLRLWKSRGSTMLLVTHDIDEAIYMSDRIVLMTPQPGRVETILSVPLPRPRVRTSSEFIALRSRILETLHLTSVQDLKQTASGD